MEGGLCDQTGVQLLSHHGIVKTDRGNNCSVLLNQIQDIAALFCLRNIVV